MKLKRREPLALKGRSNAPDSRGGHPDLRGLGEDVLDDVEDLIDGERLECVGGVEPRLLPRVAQRGDLWGVGLRVEG